MAENEMNGFTVAYGRDEAPFPVYVAGLAAIILVAAGLYKANPVMFGLGAVATGFALYNWPLAEIGRPRFGANQYGVFIEGFGIIGWRAIDRIDLAQIAVRAVTLNELQIGLKVPVSKALITDWRRMPWYRQLMRLPWTMTYDNTIRITLDPFDKEPEEIHRTFQRMWRHYRS
jgi:hypothetical protein